MHSGASGEPHRCASQFPFLFPLLSLWNDLGGGAAWGPEGTSQESAGAAEQIGEQTVTLGHSHGTLSGEPETSGGGLRTITHMLHWLDDTFFHTKNQGVSN